MIEYALSVAKEGSRQTGNSFHVKSRSSRTHRAMMTARVRENFNQLSHEEVLANIVNGSFVIESFEICALSPLQATENEKTILS